MVILAIDTSTPSGSVAVLEDQRVKGVVGTDAEEPYSSRLFRQLDFLLRELSLEVRRIDLYAVVAGPGSFTGLRVGLTAVKGWAEVHGRPVAAVSGLEAVAALARGAGGSVAPVMDARRAQIYGGLYLRTPAGLERNGDDAVMTAEEFLRELVSRNEGQTPLFASPAPHVLTEALQRSAFRGVEVEQTTAMLAPAVGLLAWQKASRGELVDALTLDANYIRRSDAELLWKG